MNRFARAVKENGGRAKVALKIDCTYEFVRLLLAGERTPGLALALRIQKQLGVPVTYWQDRTAVARELDSKGGAT